MKRIVLFAVGSPLAIDAEEACLRAGYQIVAGVRNVDAPVWTSPSVPVVDLAEVTDALRDCECVVALFTPAYRRRAFDAARAAGLERDATLIDPSSAIARSASIGEGTFVNAGCVVAGGCRIGARVVVNRSASLGHHARIDDYVSIGPGVVLAGAVAIGRGAVIGPGAVVMPEVSIGDNAVVAAGSVLRKPVPAGSLVGGNPCRVLRSGIAGYKDLAV